MHNRPTLTEPELGVPLAAFALAYPCAVWQSQSISNLKERVSGEASTSVIAEKASQPKRRYHWRIWLLAFIALLLSIKVIHRAMQPKYQGKTAAEWFAAYEGQIPLGCVNPPKPATDTIFNRIGTNAAVYLWAERNRSEGKLANWFWNVKAGRLGSTKQIDDEGRRLNAGICLLLMGDSAVPLIPELVTRVDGQDIHESIYAAQLLGQIHQMPEVCVPALIRAIEQTNRIPQREHMVYVDALKSFGGHAEAALPAMLQLHQVTRSQNNAQVDQVALALLEIDPGKYLDQYWTNILDPSDQRRSLIRLLGLMEASLITPESANKLLRYSQTVTNEAQSKFLQKAARVISNQRIEIEDLSTMP